MAEDKRSLLQRFIIWREKNIKEKRFILILSFLVGIFTAFAALILKVIIHWIQNFLTDNFNATEANYLYLVYPVVGIFLTGLFVRYVVKDDISHGVTKILYAISRRQGRIKRHNTWSSIIASSITIGFGGSVGAEAPIVLTGSAIGSNLGTIFKMEHRTLMLLVGCGAAGAVAGIFKAPIAGLVFTLEVLMIDLTMSSLLPLLISAVTAATVSYIVTGTDAMFKFHLDQAFELERIPYVIMLGIFCGLVSLYFTRAMNSVEGVFGRLRTPYKKLIMGGAMLSILIFLFPPLYGEGYDTIELLLNGMSNAEWDTVMNNSFFYGHGNLLLIYLILIILFKVFASSATNGGGGCGGIFAPSLYLGCIAGFVFSHFSNEIEMTAYLPEKNFALMGMAGVMSGVMHAPLTGVFLIAELTGGYDLFLPLMIVSVSSYLTIIMFEPHSIYSMRLAKKGELLTHHKDKAILTLMKMENVVEKDFVTVHPEMDLGELVKAISASHRNVFPVTDKEGVLIGIVLLDDIRNIMFRQELYHRFTVGKLMTSAPARLYDTDSMEQVMRTFDDTKAWNLPVVDADGELTRGARIIELYEDQFKFDTWISTPSGREAAYYYPSGLNSDEEQSMAYLPATGTSPKKQGVAYTYYEGKCKRVADIAACNKVKEGVMKNFSIEEVAVPDHFAYDFRTLVKIPERGVYRFYTFSDDGSKLYIDGKLIVDNDGGHSGRRAEGKVALEAGYHELHLLYFEDYMGQELEVGYSGRNVLETVLPDTMLFVPD